LALTFTVFEIDQFYVKNAHFSTPFHSTLNLKMFPLHCEVKKRLVQPGLVWSRTLSILQSMNGESVSLPVFAWWANTSSNFTAGSWKMDNWMKYRPKCQKC